MARTLYRGTSNNGVGTILTEDAIDAYETRALHASRHGGIFRGAVDAALFEVQAKGTFAFVRAGADYDDYYRGFVTGTWDDLDRWVKLGGVIISNDFIGSNFVPFSNGELEEEHRYIRDPEEVAAAFCILLAEVRHR